MIKLRPWKSVRFRVLDLYGASFLNAGAGEIWGAIGSVPLALTLYRAHIRWLFFQPWAAAYEIFRYDERHKSLSYHTWLSARGRCLHWWGLE